MSHRAPGRWKSKFARFVAAYGAVRLAEQLQVHPTAIYQWVRGAIRPKWESAENIQRLAREHGTRLTCDEIYGHSRDRRATDRAVVAEIERKRLRSVGGTPEAS